MLSFAAEERLMGLRIPLSIAILVVSAGLTAPADAAPRRLLHVGVTGGYHLTSGDFDLLGDRTLVRELESAPAFALKVGLWLLDPIDVELSLGIVPMSTNTGASALSMPIHADVILHAVQGDVVPYVAVGGGMYALIGGDVGSDVDALFTGGAGARFYVARGLLAIRVDARVYLSDAIEGGIAPNFVFGAGVDIYPGDPVDGPLPPEPGEGDTDGDGVIDDDDKCPQVPGVPNLEGCPDGDGDGVGDEEDECPETPGVEQFFGCPDSDGDGIPDTADACPTKPGLDIHAGCPDGDDDGVPDGKDLCPTLKGVPDRKGCPEVPAEARELFDGVIEGVSFKRGSADLSARSFPVLARVADVLRNHQYLRIEIASHSGPKGNPEKLYALTTERAQAIFDHLVRLGVDRRQLRAIGHGPDKPSPDLSKGEQERIEMTLVD